MNYISVMAVTEDVARSQAAEKTGYDPSTIGMLALVVNHHNNSRQYAHIFETSNDVTKHPHYVQATLHDALGAAGSELTDGDILVFGPEVTVGG